MARLCFRFGVMNSFKSATLLAMRHSYLEQGRKVILIKPAVDTRSGKQNVASRVGLLAPADITLEENDVLSPPTFQNVDCVLVDESQFLTPSQVDQLRSIAQNTLIICFGLKTDYRSRLFPGSQRLLEVADEIEEIATICAQCTAKAMITGKRVGGQLVKDGSDSPDIGGEEKYISLCWKCWNRAA